ncbi:MAG: hypothetical protein ABR985_16865 [Methanotrichaceae archaeon]|jgi:hypothetical protein
MKIVEEETGEEIDIEEIDLDYVAGHEAYHAIVALALGCNIATNIFTDDQVKKEQAWGNTTVYYHDNVGFKSDENTTHIEDLVAWNSAGILWDLIHCEKEVDIAEELSQVDLNNIEEAFDKMKLKPKVRRRLKDDGLKLADSMIRKHRAKVFELAKMLKESQRGKIIELSPDFLNRDV